jgi:hypothetical protein
MRKVTNIFKAQFGGGTEQTDSAKMMTQSIYSAIKKGQTPKQVYEALIERKVNQDMALQLVTSVVNFMMQNGELEQEDLEEQEQQEAQAAQQKAEEDAIAEQQMAADKDAEAEAQMNTYNEQSLAAANEDPGYDQEAQAVLGFQDGGGLDMAAMYSQMQKQAPDATQGMDSLIAATAGTQSISFPGIEEYVYPYMPILSEDPSFDPSMFAKYGGAAKKKFTKNVMGLLKKAEGGEDEVLNDTTASQFDTLDGEVKKKQSSFINAVGEEAKKLKINEWFNKLQETGDPMLEQLTSPAPEVPNPAEQQMKRGGSKQNKKYQRLLKKANKLLNINEMPGTLGLPVDYYNKFNSGFRDQRFGTIDSEDLARFTDQQKEVSINPSRGYMPYIDVYESGFFGRPKKYRIGYTPVGIQPKDKSSQQQAEEATVKNNIRYLPNPGYEGSEAPAGTMLDIVDDVSVKPISFGADWREHGKTAFGVTPNSQIATPILMGAQQYIQPEVSVSNTKIIGDAKIMKKGKGSQPGYVQYEIQVPAPNGQMFTIQTEFNREPTEADIQELIQSATEKQTGGVVGSGDPSIPALSQFVYGGMDFPEESKNTNDPYFTDTYPMQMAQQGGDPTQFTHYTHGADDIFHDQMNMMVAQNGAEVQAFDPSQMYNLDYLKTLVKDLKHEGKLARRDGRRSARATNSTLRDYLLPVNPMLRYSGSWAEQMGMPYNYETGLAYEGSLDGAKLATRDVTDRGIFGRPKEWTDYYILNSDGEPAFNPNQQPQFNQEEVSQEIQDQEDYGKLGMRARMAVNKGERKTERQLERGERKGYNEPTPSSKNQSLEEFATSLGYPDVETLRKAINDKTIKNFEIPEELRKQMMEYQEGGQPQFNFYDQLNENLYNPIEEYRRGGRLRRASMGMANTSVAYNDNPIFNNGLDPNAVLGNQDQAAPIQSPDYWSNMSGTQTQFNPPQQPTDQITINQNDQAQGTIQQKQDPIKLPNIIGVDRRRQDMTTFDPEAMLNTGNAAARGVLGFLNRKDDRQQEQEMYANNFNPMNIYGKKERMDRGDWEVNQGSYRMNQTGADRLGRSKQYGGQAFNEGEELYMTEEEIKQFLANGGQLEYL